MRKLALVPIMVVICCGLIACYENEKKYAGGKYSKEVELAITALKGHWTERYRISAEHDFVRDGYLEIKNTRVIVFKDNAARFLGHDGLGYLVDFVIFTDYYGAYPYYFNTTVANTIAIFKDGRTEVLRKNPINDYHFSASASVGRLQYRGDGDVKKDYYEFIESIHDLNGEYNTVMKLGVQ